MDNIFPHHEDEIAQSEAAFGKPYVRYWVHGQHLLADGVKMAKSAGNEFILADLEQRGFDALAFRYLCLTVRYRHRMNFTFSALRASERALTSLRDRVWQWRSLPEQAAPVESLEWSERFWDAVDDDLDLPKALASTWNMLHSPLPDRVKMDLLLEYDEVLGLGLDSVPEMYEIPGNVRTQVDQRSDRRQQADYSKADEIRQDLSSNGYLVKDSVESTKVRQKTGLEQQQSRWKSISSPKEVQS